MDMREKDRPLIETAGSPSGAPALELSLAAAVERLTSGTVPANGHLAPSSSATPPAPRTAPKTLLETPHPYRGRLICVEGIDGSGKSTQLLLLERWLRSRGYPVHFTEWNSSRLVRRSMQRGKKKNLLTPTTFSLLHAVDFADRMTYQILPPLKAGMIVLADRYVYTAFARDVARGVHPDWVRAVYSPALRPDLTLYFRVPIDISLERLLSGRAKLKYHEAGMDVGLSTDPVESFRMFQSRVLAIYDQLTEEFGMRPIDATAEIPNQQRVVRKMVQEILADYDRDRANGKNGVTSQPR
jgi:dTMP kinase